MCLQRNVEYHLLQEICAAMDYLGALLIRYDGTSCLAHISHELFLSFLLSNSEQASQSLSEMSRLSRQAIWLDFHGTSLSPRPALEREEVTSSRFA